MLNPAPRAGFDGNVPALGPPRLFDWTPIRLRLRGAFYGNSRSFVNWDDDFGTGLSSVLHKGSLGHVTWIRHSGSVENHTLTDGGYSSEEFGLGSVCLTQKPLIKMGEVLVSLTPGEIVGSGLT